MLAVYGEGKWQITPSGLTLPADYRVGTVYNIWDGGAPYIYGNDVVYWKEGDQNVRVVTGTDNNTYTLIPARLVTVDTPLL